MSVFIILLLLYSLISTLVVINQNTKIKLLKDKIKHLEKWLYLPREFIDDILTADTQESEKFEFDDED